MKNKKLKFILLFSMATLFICLPFIMTRERNRNLFQKPQVSTVAVKKYEQENELTIEEKIALICEYKGMNKNIIQVDKNQFLDSIKTTKIPDVVTDEIHTLIEKEAMPYIDMSEKYTISEFSMKSYIDSTNLAKRVKVWDITLQGDKNIIRLGMDVETHKILEFNMNSVEERQEFIHFYPENFFEYLGLRGEEYESSYVGLEGYRFPEDGIMYSFSLSRNYLGINIESLKK